MPAVDNLYNPFRDQKKGKSKNNSNKKADVTPTKVKHGDAFGAFNFEIHPSPERFPALSQNHSALSADSNQENNPQNPEFDPFRVAEYDPFQVAGLLETRKVATANSVTTPSTSSRHVEATKSPPAALAPKLVVKLSTCEEVTSRVQMAIDEFDVNSEISVEGTVYAQVQCSNASKNAPFALLVPRVPGGEQCFSIRPNEKYAVSKNSSGNMPVLVTIPKQDIVAVPIAYYSLQRELKFMPVLVERKITRNGTRIRIAIQIRSRLDNTGDMEDMTILVAVPEKVNGESVVVSRGAGVWDDLKRTIKWKLPALYKGDSALVSAEADLWHRPAPGEDETPFPILFRCSSVCDQITDLDWKLAQVSGSPANITVASIQHTFRLLHRLP